MGEIMNGIRSVGQLLLRNRGKILLLPLIALAWVPFVFPYSDLRSVVATKLSRAIGDGIAIDFDQIALAVGFPVALELQGFQFEGPGLPAILADRLIAKPSLSSVFTGRPAGSVEADGVFEGNIIASLASGASLKEGGKRQDIRANLAGIQLASLTDAFRRVGMMNFNVQGTVDSNALISIDPEFNDQPQGDILLQGKTISIPSVNIAIPNMGSVQTPSLQLGRVEVKGRMSDGKVQLEDFVFGQEKDSLSGRIRGELEVGVQNVDQQKRLTMGNYNLKIEVTVAKPLMDAMVKSGAALVFLPVDGFKTESANTIKYAFQVSGPNFMSTPRFTKLGL